MIHGKPEPELTAEQLRIAFREMYRPGRPETVDAMLAHPIYGPCLRGIARQRSRAPISARPQRTSLPAAVLLPTPSHAAKPTAAPRALPRPPAFDARKAAANDRDD